MFNSSSESSLEQGSLPSVINLFAAGQLDEPSTPTNPSRNVIQPLSYVDPLLISPSSSSSAASNPPINKYAVDRIGSCGSPVSTSSSSSSSSSDTTCNGDHSRRHRNSTTSTSTNSSEDDVIPNTLRSPCLKSMNNPRMMGVNKSPQATALYGPESIPASSMIMTASPSSPSSRTASSSNSGSRSVRITGGGGGGSGNTSINRSTISSGAGMRGAPPHFLINRGINDSMGIHSQTADSGISNTSPETQSSTEFHPPYPYHHSYQITMPSTQQMQHHLHRQAFPESQPLTGSLPSNNKSAGLKVSHSSSSGCFSGHSTAGLPSNSILPNQSLLKHKNRHDHSFLPLSYYKRDYRRRNSTFFCDYLVTILSILYSMILSIIGLIIPIIEVISPYRFLNSHESFYIYLLAVGVLCLVILYTQVARDSARSHRLNSSCSVNVQLAPLPPLDPPVMTHVPNMPTNINDTHHLHPQSIYTGQPNEDMTNMIPQPSQEPSESACNQIYVTNQRRSQSAGLLLRLAILVMGLVVMIRDGLLFGRVLDSGADSSPHCSLPSLAVRHVFSLIYTFLQLYFVFIHSKIRLQRLHNVARFGLLHMAVVNLCSVAKTLVKDAVFEESSSVHKLNDYYHRYPNYLTLVNGGSTIKPTNRITTLDATRLLLKEEGLFKPKLRNHIFSPMSSTPASTTLRLTTQKHNLSMFCDGGDLMQGIVQSTEPYLYPFAIQFYILSAVLLLVTWNNLNPYYTNSAATKHSASSPTDLATVCGSDPSSITPTTNNSSSIVPCNHQHNRQLRNILSRRNRNHNDNNNNTNDRGRDRHYSTNQVARIITNNPLSARGLFAGLSCIVAALVDVLVCHIIAQKPLLRLTAYKVTVSMEIVILLVTSCACLLLLIKRRSKLVTLHTDCIGYSWQDIVLLVSMATGVLLQATIDLVSGMLLTNNPATALTITHAVVALIQVTIQTLVLGNNSSQLSCCNHRYINRITNSGRANVAASPAANEMDEVSCHTNCSNNNRAGRQLLVFIALANAALCCYPSFRRKWRLAATFEREPLFGRPIGPMLARTTVAMETLYRLMSGLTLARGFCAITIHSPATSNT